jgi:DNA-binding MarR family transcriptional regulator
VVTTETSFLDGYMPYLLRRADHALSAPLYALLSKRCIALSEWRVLAVLQQFGELSVADLAEAALSPQPTVTHASRRLEQRGLVARTSGTTDKRQRFISITPEGSSLTSDLINEAKRLEADALADAGDLTELVHRLQELTDIVCQQRISNA